MTAAPTNPPAVVRGSPRAFHRWARRIWWVIAISIATGLVVFAITAPGGANASGGYIVFWTGVLYPMLAVGFLGLLIIAINQERVRRAFRRIRRPCLNCLCDLTDSETLCPECGHTQNAKDLNVKWKKYLAERYPR